MSRRIVVLADQVGYVYGVSGGLGSESTQLFDEFEQPISAYSPQDPVDRSDAHVAQIVCDPANAAAATERPRTAAMIVVDHQLAWCARVDAEDLSD